MSEPQLEDAVHEAARMIANSITPVEALSGHDAQGGYVSSLTEAIMGMTGALTSIANALEHLAEAARDR